MNFCSECGNEATLSANYCSKCGLHLREDTIPTISLKVLEALKDVIDKLLTKEAETKDYIENLEYENKQMAEYLSNVVGLCQRDIDNICS